MIEVGSTSYIRELLHELQGKLVRAWAAAICSMCIHYTIPPLSPRNEGEARSDAGLFGASRMTAASALKYG
jgi:hypothetical protein